MGHLSVAGCSLYVPLTHRDSHLVRTLQCCVCVRGKVVVGNVCVLALPWTLCFVSLLVSSCLLSVVSWAIHPFLHPLPCGGY